MLKPDQFKHMYRQPSPELPPRVYSIHPKMFFRNCLNCDYWRDGEPRRQVMNGPLIPTQKGCSLVGIVPPPEIIVHGCESYKDELDIPF